MRVVIALGGNALLRRGEPADARAQLANMKQAAAVIAALCRDHDVVVTHGNGPQVGLLALQDDAQPLDVLDAESEGMVGYLLEQELANQLPGREVVTLLTRVEVDADDPAFRTPTKPVGPVYAAEEVADLVTQRGWTLHEDGNGFRRVVPSPRPRRIIGLHAIQLLVENAMVVVCAGGGGIPVAGGDGRWHGVEAVIDKDRTSAMLAEGIGADALLLLTDADAVVVGWGTPGARRIREAGAETIATLALAAGSMGPKVEAAAWFAGQGGRSAIGTLAEAAAVLAGETGTLITPGDGAVELWPEP